MFAIELSNVYELARKGMVYSDTPVFDHSGKFRMLTSDVKFKLSNGKELIIKAGFQWDENSIPYLFQWAFPKSGIYSVPALIHDALYYLTQGDRKFADMEFAIWMCALKIKVKQVVFRLFVVDLFGGRWWKRNLVTPSVLCLKNREYLEIYG